MKNKNILYAYKIQLCVCQIHTFAKFSHFCIKKSPAKQGFLFNFLPFRLLEREVRLVAYRLPNKERPSLSKMHFELSGRQ